MREDSASMYKDRKYQKPRKKVLFYRDMKRQSYNYLFHIRGFSTNYTLNVKIYTCIIKLTRDNYYYKKFDILINLKQILFKQNFNSSVIIIKKVVIKILTSPTILRIHVNTRRSFARGIQLIYLSFFKKQ